MLEVFLVFSVIIELEIIILISSLLFCLGVTQDSPDKAIRLTL